jgi:hypothetical protein
MSGMRLFTATHPGQAGRSVLVSAGVGVAARSPWVGVGVPTHGGAITVGVMPGVRTATPPRCLGVVQLTAIAEAPLPGDRVVGREPPATSTGSGAIALRSAAMALGTMPGPAIAGSVKSVLPVIHGPASRRRVNVARCTTFTPATMRQVAAAR